MSGIELKIRKMKTDETLVACFESEADAVTWLEDREQFVEVLGTADDSISVEVSNRLRAAMRPMDDEEKAFLDEQAKRLAAARMLAEQTAHEQAQRAKEARQQAMQELGPNEPMRLNWTLEDGLTKADADDPRDIPEAAVRAFDEWLAERQTWVKAPDVVDTASVTVYPGKVPLGDDRVQTGGQFTVSHRE